MAGVAAAAVLAGSSAASAQRYRILIGVPGGRAEVAEFQPCIPAEGSGCGAWIDRTSPARNDQPAVVTAARTRDGTDSVYIQNGAVRMEPRRSSSGTAKVLGIKRALARAIVITPDSKYVFASFESTAADEVTILMIDLDTHTAIEKLVLPRVEGGLAMAR